MSPDKKLDFENEWGDLQRRLRHFLFRKKVPAGRHDDLVQETALRLLLMWDQVDRSRSPWPLTATIVTNLLRDEGRVRPVREVVGDLPEKAAMVDVERSGLARVELARVRAAMAALTGSQRAALLQEIGAVAGNGHSPDAEKMLRLRARRKLSSMMRDVSAIAVLRYRRLIELVQGLVPSYDGLLPTGACVICLLLGLSGGMVLETPAPAEARQLRDPRGATIVVDSVDVVNAATAPTGVDAATDARPERTSTSSATSEATERGAKKKTSGGSSPASVTSSGGVTVPVPRTPPLPQPGDQPTEVRADATPPETPETPEAPSQDDSPVQLPLPEAVTDPLDAAGDL